MLIGEVQGIGDGIVRHGHGYSSTKERPVFDDFDNPLHDTINDNFFYALNDHSAVFTHIMVEENQA